MTEPTTEIDDSPEAAERDAEERFNADPNRHR